MVAVPAANAVTTPDELTFAFAESLLIHVPPVRESDNVMLDPIQTVDGPVIGGTADTVIVLITLHPPTV